jgi:hypothetical protein
MLYAIALPVFFYFLVVVPVTSRLDRAAIVQSSAPAASAAHNPRKHSGVVDYTNTKQP